MHTADYCKLLVVVVWVCICVYMVVCWSCCVVVGWSCGLVVVLSLVVVHSPMGPGFQPGGVSHGKRLGVVHIVVLEREEQVEAAIPP